MLHEDKQFSKMSPICALASSHVNKHKSNTKTTREARRQPQHLTAGWRRKLAALRQALRNI